MTRRSTARASALLAGAILVLAACGPAGTATIGPGGTQGPGDTSAPVTQLPGFSFGPELSFVLPSFNSDPELEALLPNEIGGAPVEKLSMSGSDLIGDGTGSEDLVAILTQFGKSPSDMSAAFGDAAGIDIIAYRVKGIDANALFQAFLGLIDNEDNVVTDATMGGKSIKRVVTPAGDTSYVYASGDVLFTIEAGPDVAPALLNELFSKLR